MTVGALDAAELVVDTTTVAAARVAAMIIASLEDASSSSVRRALFRKVHCLQIPIPSAEDGLASYRDAPGHALIWHTDTAAGLRMAESSSEIVIQTERPQLGANLTVRRGRWSAQPSAQRLRMLLQLESGTTGAGTSLVAHGLLAFASSEHDRPAEQYRVEP